MKTEKARYLVENMDEVAQRDRVWLNNPVIFHTLGIAPLVVVDTTAHNALMLFAAVLFLLLPVRLISALLAERLPADIRPMVTCFVAALAYIPAYFGLTYLFQQNLLALGIYLPMLVCEPLILQRFEHAPDTSIRDVFNKGVSFTIGYGLVLMLLGMIRELLGAGTLFGARITEAGLFPLASMPVGGFVLLGLIAAVWRGSVSRFKKYVNMEAKRSV